MTDDVHSYHAKAPLASLLMTLLMTSFFGVVASSCPTGKGTTEDLRAVVTGRCVQYKSLVNPQAFCDKSEELNCTEVAVSFIQAFAHQQPCHVNMTRFDEFLALTRHDIADGKNQFWSGTYGVVHRYSQGGKRVVTLEDTLSGYLIDSLHFCSSPSEPGGIGHPGTTDCSTYSDKDDCHWDAEAAFWAMASKNFATKAKGVVSVMLNASRPEAFRPTSYFATWELPNINDDVVPRVDIELAHVPGDVVRHTCESDNIKAFESQLDARKIPHTCVSNPPDLMWLLCWEHRDKPECQNFISSGAGPMVSMTTTASLPLPWMLPLTVIMYILL